MKVAIAGTGYVGLVRGACLAEAGNQAPCPDLDLEKIRSLVNGDIPIHEPGLLEMVHRNVAAGRLQFTTGIDRAVNHNTIQFFAVGTPPDEDGSVDLKYVLEADKSIGSRMIEYKVVVDDRSQKPYSTNTNALLKRIGFVVNNIAKGSGLFFYALYAPRQLSFRIYSRLGWSSHFSGGLLC